jgi:hypothetical protein
MLFSSGLENRDYGRRGSAALTMRHLHLQKLALTSPTSGGLSVGIVRSRTKATELACYSMYTIDSRMDRPTPSCNSPHFTNSKEDRIIRGKVLVPHLVIEFPVFTAHIITPSL